MIIYLGLIDFIVGHHYGFGLTDISSCEPRFGLMIIAVGSQKFQVVSPKGSQRKVVNFDPCCEYRKVARPLVALQTARSGE